MHSHSGYDLVVYFNCAQTPVHTEPHVVTLQARTPAVDQSVYDAAVCGEVCAPAQREGVGYLYRVRTPIAVTNVSYWCKAYQKRKNEKYGLNCYGGQTKNDMGGTCSTYMDITLWSE